MEILDGLSDGKRNIAANLAYILDKDRAYINTRLPVLADYGLVDRIGPSQTSGLYEITPKGQAVIANRDAYRTDGVDFEALIEQELDDLINAAPS